MLDCTHIASNHWVHWKFRGTLPYFRMRFIFLTFVVQQVVIAYCSHPGRGQRLFPDGTLNSAHFVETPDYVQITGTGNFQKINIAAGDAGGELDPHGAGTSASPMGNIDSSLYRWHGESSWRSCLFQRLDKWYQWSRRGELDISYLCSLFSYNPSKSTNGPTS